MYVLITGTPGCGKSTLANLYGKRHPFKIINDKNYSKMNRLGTDDKREKEYVVDIALLNKSFSDFIKNNEGKNFVFEGHLWPEMSKVNLNLFDKIILLKTDCKILRARYEERGYSEVKIEENLLCEDSFYVENLFKKKGVKYIGIKVNSDLKTNFKEIENKINYKPKLKKSIAKIPTKKKPTKKKK